MCDGVVGRREVVERGEYDVGVGSAHVYGVLYTVRYRW